MGAATFFTYNVYRPTREPLHRLAGTTTADKGHPMRGFIRRGCILHIKPSSTPQLQNTMLLTYANKYNVHDVIMQPSSLLVRHVPSAVQYFALSSIICRPVRCNKWPIGTICQSVPKQLQLQAFCLTRTLLKINFTWELMRFARHNQPVRRYHSVSGHFLQLVAFDFSPNV